MELSLIRTLAGEFIPPLFVSQVATVFSCIEAQFQSPPFINFVLLPQIAPTGEQNLYNSALDHDVECTTKRMCY